MDVSILTLAVSAQMPGRFDVEEPVGVYGPNPASASSLKSYFVQDPPSRERDPAIVISLVRAGYVRYRKLE